MIKGVGKWANLIAEWKYRAADKDLLQMHSLGKEVEIRKSSVSGSTAFNIQHAHSPIKDHHSLLSLKYLTNPIILYLSAQFALWPPSIWALRPDKG